MVNKLKNCWQKFLKLDIFLDVKVPFLLLVLILIIAKIPSLFEPFWYGDEAIYLTIGNALNKGWRLYSDIFDHKTPLIYFIAALSNSNMVIWHLIGLFFALANLFAFDQILRVFFGHKGWKITIFIWIIDLLYLFTFNLPLLEGNIFNAEMVFITFGLFGGYFWLKSGALNCFRLGRNQLQILDENLTNSKRIEKKIASSKLTENRQHELNISWKNWWSPIAWTKESKLTFAWAFLAGVFFSLSFLTKFQGLFDMYAWFIPLAFLALAALKKQRPALRGVIFGFILPILFFIILFALQGNIADFWQAAFVYSSAYSSYAQVGNNFFTNFVFSTNGKLICLLLVTSAIWWQYRKIDWSIMIGTLWFFAALTAATLSNRSYPHYFLQIIPPLFLLFGGGFYQLFRLSSLSIKLKWQNLAINIFFVLLCFFWAVMSINVFEIKNLTSFSTGWKNTSDYYLNFYKYVTGKQNVYGMYGYFDSLMKDNYAIAAYIEADENPYLFIWGNNPSLYAQTGKLPISNYTVNYHVYDFAKNIKGEDPLGLQITGLVKHKPKYAVIMNSIDAGSQEKADEIVIKSFLEDYYIPLSENEAFTLWQLIN